MKHIYSLHRLYLWLIAILMALLIVSCDSGDIEEQGFSVESTGQSVKLTATVTGLSAWKGGYNISLAGFSEGSNYAVMQRSIPTSTADGTQVELVLNNLSGQVSTVEFAITNNLRKRILTLASINLQDYSENIDTINIDMGQIDIRPFGSLQYGLFNKACIQCHGGNGRSAAGLNLTEGQAEKNLVDVSSATREGMFRVVSGDASASLLHQILAEGGEGILHYNHTEVLSSQFKENADEIRSLIDDWIENLPN